MIWIIWITVFAAFFLSAYGIMTAGGRRLRVKVRVGNPGPVSVSPLLRQLKEQPSSFKEWLVHGLTSAGQWALPDLDKVSEMRKDLIKAGYRHPHAPAIYLGLRIMAAFAFALSFLLFVIIRGQLKPATLGAALLLAVFGFFLVSMLLGRKIRARQENLDRALPDIIDMFVICMEAGLSLNAALQRVSDESRGVFRDFSDELQITAGDLRAGLTWEEAFDNLGRRTDVQSIRSMVGLMIQSNKLGASIADALRNHAEFIRAQRILIAEEKAAKLPVKMIFPLIFFIMPAIMIVAVGPGAIHIIDKMMTPGSGILSGTGFKIR